MKARIKLSDKHAHLYMSIAKVVASPEHNSCLSRSLGAVVVDRSVPGGRVISVGYNGPACGLPACDSKEHLQNVVLPQLTEDEFLKITQYANRNLSSGEGSGEGSDNLAQRLAGSGKCPRKLIGACSGDRLELCASCSHAERNAIIRAGVGLVGMTIFCHSPLPCHDCANAIIQSGIDQVYYIDNGDGDYSKSSRWMFQESGVDLFCFSEEEFNV